MGGVSGSAHAPSHQSITGDLAAHNTELDDYDTAWCSPFK